MQYELVGEPKRRVGPASRKIQFKGVDIRIIPTQDCKRGSIGSEAEKPGATGSMNVARAQSAATLLNDGKVLVTGGLDASGSPLQTAEIYDPSTGAFSFTSGNMQFVHAAHTSTLLNTGKVLIVGWGNATAELYDPATGTFTATGSMVMARVDHTATLLSSGKVLIVGGIQGVAPNTTVLAEAELYDPTTGTFSKTAGSLTTARENHTESLLASGKVLLAGGLDATGKAIASAELFDPSSQNFTTANTMLNAHAFHTATVLNDGTVLLAGGVDATNTVMAECEIYDPNSGNFAATGTLVNARGHHTATLLEDGRVLAAGGDGTSVIGLTSAELYQ